MITAKKQIPNKLFAAGVCFPYVATSLLRALSYAQAAITTSQRAGVATIEILFAKDCKNIIRFVA